MTRYALTLTPAPRQALVGRRRLISVTKCLLWSTILISLRNIVRKWTWNEWDFRPPVCTYRLNWARITSWGWWDEWDDTALQTQDSQFEPWRSYALYSTYGSRRLTTILFFTSGWGRNIFVSFKPPRQGNEPGSEPGIGVKGSGANRYPSAPAHLYHQEHYWEQSNSPQDEFTWYMTTQ